MNDPKKAEIDDVDGPAIVRADHVRERPAKDDHGKPITGKTAWKRLSPLESSYDKNQLAGGSPKYLAHQRYEAGAQYAKLWALSQSSGRDSTDMDRVSKSGAGASLSQSQADAMRSLVGIHMHLGERDRAIVRMVCGEGYWPSEAVRTICADYRDAVVPRFREALDALIEAMAVARKNSGPLRASRETL